MTEDINVKRITDSASFRYMDISRGGNIGLLNGRNGLVNICFQIRFFNRCIMRETFERMFLF